MRLLSIAIVLLSAQAHAEPERVPAPTWPKLAGPVHAAPEFQVPPPSRPDAEGFIRNWLVLAPIFYEGLWPAGEEELDRASIPGEATLRPRAGQSVRAGGQSATWKAIRSEGWGVDLAAATGTTETKFRYAYLASYVVSAEARRGVRLRVGTNDLARVWLNGKQVLRNLTLRPLEKDQSAAFVDLRKGVNILVMKVANDETRWGAAARFIEQGQTPVAGLEIALEPDGGGPRAQPDGDGFIRDWLVLGPFTYVPRPYARGQLARAHLPQEGTLAPRPGEGTFTGAGPTPWLPVTTKEHFIDFNEHSRGLRAYHPKARVEANDSLFMALGYAVAYVTSPQDRRDLTLKLGANDHGKAWVNGKAVAVKDVAGKLEKDQASGRVTLRKGVNVVVLKVVNAGDAWQGAVRFVDRAGQPVTDLEVRVTPPETPAERARRE